MEDTLNRYIGEKVKSLRAEEELTQEEFVKRIYENSGLKFSASSISNIENGNQSIYLVDLYVIADAFDKEIDYFLPSLSKLKELTPTVNKQIKELHGKEKSLAAQLLEKLEEMKEK